MTSNESLGDEIAEIAGRSNVIAHRMLTCIRQFDEAEGWHEQGAQSCAHWLSWRVGFDPVTAREKVRVARALGALPAIDGALAAGQISYAKVRAMTRVATPANEARVLEVALAATGAQLERICRGLKKATAPEAEQAAERRIRAVSLGSGLVKLEVIVSADEADLLVRAIERARETMRPSPTASTASASAEAARTSAPRAARPCGADGLIHIAMNFLADEHATTPEASAPDTQLIIHLDRDIGGPAGAMAASLDDGTPVSSEALRRVACDGGIVTALVDEQTGVLDIGRRTRAIPTAIKRALWLRDQGCRFPGCTNRRFIHGHHVQHWLHGGRTALSNLVSLCSWHHRLVHEGGFTIAVGDSNGVEVRTPSGALLPAAPALEPDSGGVEWLGDWWTATDSFNVPQAAPVYWPSLWFQSGSVPVARRPTKETSCNGAGAKSTGGRVAMSSLQPSSAVTARMRTTARRTRAVITAFIGAASRSRLARAAARPGSSARRSFRQARHETSRRSAPEQARRVAIEDCCVVDDRWRRGGRRESPRDHGRILVVCTVSSPGAWVILVDGGSSAPGDCRRLGGRGVFPDGRRGQVHGVSRSSDARATPEHASRRRANDERPETRSARWRAGVRQPWIRSRRPSSTGFWPETPTFH